MDLQIGMLWYDDARDRPLADKIARAVAHYQAKYGHLPNTCYLPLALASEPVTPPEGLQIKGALNILPDHLWLGVA